MYCILYFIIVVCDPPCVHGACISDNNCSCSEGYDGENCNNTST